MNPNNEKQIENEKLVPAVDEKPTDLEVRAEDKDDVFYVPEERQVKKKENKKTGIKNPKVFIPIIAAVVIIAVVLILVLGGKSSSATTYVLQSVKSVMSGTSASNRFSGVIETQKTESVAFDTSQKLDKLFVAEGNTVKKGDPLFSYNTDSINLSIQKLQVENEISQNSIKSNNEQISQYQSMMSSATASEQITYTAQIQELQASNAQLEYNIKTKNAEIATKQKSLENATVTAPIDGTIKKIADLSGNDSDSGQGTNDASAYITITASGNLRVKGTVSEQNISEIMAGTKVIVRSRVDNTQTWSGTVTSVVTTTTEQNNNNYYYSSSNESSSKYPFYVDLDSTEGLILGQHVTIEVDYGQAETKEGIWLNSAWLIFEGENAYVMASRTASGTPEKRQVTLGEYDANLDEYEIKDGLTEAEFIAIPESNMSDDGDYSYDSKYADEEYSDGIGYDASDDSYSEDDFSVDVTEGNVSGSGTSNGTIDVNVSDDDIYSDDLYGGSDDSLLDDYEEE